MKSIVVLLTAAVFALGAVAEASAKGRTGSKRSGGYSSHGKGSHYKGGKTSPNKTPGRSK